MRSRRPDGEQPRPRAPRLRSGGVDVADIAEVAARIFADPGPHAGKTYTLTGGASLSMHQYAAAIGEAIGTGKEPRTIADFVQRYADAFVKR